MTPQGQGMILILFCFISNLIHVQLFHVPHTKKERSEQQVILQGGLQKA